MSFALHAASAAWLPAIAERPVSLPPQSLRVAIVPAVPFDAPAPLPKPVRASRPRSAEPVATETSPSEPVLAATAAAAPPAPAETAEIEPAVEPPSFEAAYLHNPPPAYPPIARRLRLQGTVVLRVYVESDGRAADLAVRESSGAPVLDEAALGAVRNWRFVPARRGSMAIALWVDVPVRFRLAE